MSRQIVTAADLFGSEKRFLRTLHELAYGRVELVKVRGGELVLDPMPKMIRSLKFGVAPPAPPQPQAQDFELKRQHIDFFQYVRGMAAGEVRVIEVHCGLPVSAEFEVAPPC